MPLAGVSAIVSVRHAFIKKIPALLLVRTKKRQFILSQARKYGPFNGSTQHGILLRLLTMLFPAPYTL